MPILLEIYVQPGAKETVLSGKHDGRLKIRLKSSPIDGKANQEVIAFMAQLLNVRKQALQIVRGHKSRLKLLAIEADDSVIKQLEALEIDYRQDG